MSVPKSIAGYPTEWGQIAAQLEKVGNFTLPCGNVKLAKKYRLQFYGFRKALREHDAANPWVAACMETELTITPSGDLHFERAPIAALLRGLLEQSIVRSPIEDAPGMDKTDETLLEVLSRAPADKSAG